MFMKNTIRSWTLTALMAAILCVLAPFSIPLGPIPLTLATLVIYLMTYLLDWKQSTVGVLVYLLLGFVGLPVFSGFNSGPGALAGPTGGFLIGYLFLAFISSSVMQHNDRPLVQFTGMAVATAVMYAFGTAWYCIQASVSLPLALSRCVWIFIPGDCAKMFCTLVLGPVLRRRLQEAHLL